MSSNTQPEALKAIKGFLILFVLGLIVYGGFSLKNRIAGSTGSEQATAISGNVSSNPTPAEINKNARAALSKAKLNAFIQSQTCVEDLLKAPATAKFPFADTDLIPQLSDSTFLVESWVDAQNSYGAMLRQYYRCIVVQHGDGSQDCLETKFVAKR